MRLKKRLTRPLTFAAAIRRTFPCKSRPMLYFQGSQENMSKRRGCLRQLHPAPAPAPPPLTPPPRAHAVIQADHCIHRRRAAFLTAAALIPQHCLPNPHSQQNHNHDPQIGLAVGHTSPLCFRRRPVHITCSWRYGHSSNHLHLVAGLGSIAPNISPRVVPALSLCRR